MLQDMNVKLNRLLTRMGFNTTRRMTFYEDLSAFYGAGIAPYQALSRMRDVARPRKSLRWLVRLLGPVLRAGTQGASLGVAMRPWVPPEEAAMLSAGEKVGQLREALDELAGLLKSRLEVREALMRNLVPSGIMIVALLTLMVYILKMVLSQGRTMVSEEIFAGLVVAPYYFGIGEWIIKWLWVIVTLAVAGGIAIAASLPRWRPSKVRSWLDRRLPPWTLYARIQSAYFLMSASAMMRAGQPFRAAATDIQQFAVPWVKTHVRRMLGRLASGSDEVRSMQVGMLPWDAEDRLTVYAMLPEFRVVMQSAARDCMKSLLKQVDLIGNIIRVIIMAILGLFIVATVFSLGEVSFAIEDTLRQMQQ